MHIPLGGGGGGGSLFSLSLSLSVGGWVSVFCFINFRCTLLGLFQEEQLLAEQQSSLLNKAYFTLLKPLPRALYLLELHGYTVDEESTEMNPEFLMEVLELNERIGEGSLDDVHEIEEEIQLKIEENVKGLAQAFAAKDYAAAKETAVRLRYYINVESKVKMFFRDRM